MKNLANFTALIVVSALYILSVGPAMWLHEKLGYPQWANPIFDLVYAPLINLFGENEPQWFTDYVFLWVSRP